MKSRYTILATDTRCRAEQRLRR